MKLKKLFKALGLIIRKPYLLNAVLQNEERFHASVRLIHPSAGKNGLPQIDFKDIADTELQAAPYAFLDGGSLPTDLILLKSLVASYNESQYFEIGTWRGESVANVSSCAKQCYTLNQSVEEMQAMGLSKQLINQLRFFSKDLQNVTHLTGNSSSFDYSEFHGKMDVVFVDGDHTYEGVKNDTEKAISLLRNEDSVIVWHDYAHNPDTVRWEVFQGILDGLPKNLHSHLYAVSNTKCAILSRKSWNTTEPVSPSTPNKAFDVSVQIR